jgi:hypothetical protein
MSFIILLASGRGVPSAEKNVAQKNAAVSHTLEKDKGYGGHGLLQICTLDRFRHEDAERGGAVWEEEVR